VFSHSLGRNLPFGAAVLSAQQPSADAVNSKKRYPLFLRSRSGFE
jgi:hypothetical protein